MVFTNIEGKNQEIEQRVAQINRVTRVTAGGRRFSFRALVVVGDKKGRVGIGIGKAGDVSDAVNKAVRQGMNRMVQVPLEGGTIPFEIEVHFKMAHVLLKPVQKGRGIIAGGIVRDICELGGIQDINAKILSASKNKINNAKALFMAFEKMRKILQVKKFQDTRNKDTKNIQ